jgi:hypothetical protein
MNAQQLHRARQKFRTALAVAFLRFSENESAGIKPDRRTALLAGQVMRCLVSYTGKAELTPAEALPIQRDDADIAKLLKARWRASKASKKRVDKARGV